jgi:hypothetical protein
MISGGFADNRGDGLSSIQHLMLTGAAFADGQPVAEKWVA